MNVTRLKQNQSSAQKPDRRKSAETRVKILDSAEAIFVRRGYYGTSMRDVAGAAEVPLALVSYHFGSKDGLFRAVIERRAPDNVTGMRLALDHALASNGGKSTLEEVLRAFIEPVVERSMRGGSGWKNYIRLMAQIASLPQQESFISAVPENYDSTVHSFIDAVRRLHPTMRESDLQWAFYIFQAAITHILSESGLIDRQSNDACRASDLDTLMPHLIRFCAAGFRAFDASNAHV